MVFLKKWMNISTGDLYSMYVVLQGIRFLPCIRLYIIYVIPFGEQQPWMPAVPKLERFNKKNRPKWSIYFYIVSKKRFFQAHRRVYPPPPVSEKYEKKLFCNENQWNLAVFLKKLMVIFSGDLYSMYVIRNWVSSMYKGIYQYIYIIYSYT